MEGYYVQFLDSLLHQILCIVISPVPLAVKCDLGGIEITIGLQLVGIYYSSVVQSSYNCK